MAASRHPVHSLKKDTKNKSRSTYQCPWLTLLKGGLLDIGMSIEMNSGCSQDLMVKRRF